MIDKEKTDIAEWVYSPRVIRQNKQFSQVFLDIASIYRIRALTKSVEDVIRQNKLRILIKKTTAYYIARIGILDSPNIKYSSSE